MFQQKTYQAKQTLPHLFEQKGPRAPKWYLVDAKDQVVGRLATILARVITGKHKATVTSHVDTGDFVVVVNSEKVVFTRNKWKQKLYYNHSGYISGLKIKTAEELLKRKPEEILRRAVWGMMSKSSLARHQMNKLKIYKGSDHPHSAQNPQALPFAAVRKTVLKTPKENTKEM
ncbi:MAG: 50S ribosomal protein L13 [Deltaproteobacteria bacterium]|nr:50S ribosomal protein L13 [Deltaproteobacteria bacterium]